MTWSATQFKEKNLMIKINWKKKVEILIQEFENIQQ